jgi:hypothetical protein
MNTNLPALLHTLSTNFLGELRDFHSTDASPTAHIKMLHLLHQSKGIKLSRKIGLVAAVQRVLLHLRNLGGHDPIIHEDGYARQLTPFAGVHALCYGNRVFI